ncbi:MAG: outer membrane protein assembly factor BamD [Planctomycetota bacterium]
MRLSPYILLAVVAVAAAGCRTSPASIPHGATAAEVKAIADAELAAKNYPTAARTYELLIDDYPRTPEADAAWWLAAEAWYFNGDLKLAQESYEDFHDAFHLHNLGVLGERMYDIGVRRYERGKSGLAGLGIMKTSDSGLRALTWITEKLHNGSRADDAYFFVGRARLRGYEFDEAVLNFSQILDDYPQSEWTYEARFLRGIAYRRINRGAAYDLDSLILARADFAIYIRIIERSEALRTEYADRLADAKEQLEEIDGLLAAKSVLIADFYRGRERFSAERMYLEHASRRYPETEAGREAKDRLEALAAGEE